MAQLLRVCIIYEEQPNKIKRYEKRIYRSTLGGRPGLRLL